MLGCEVGVFGEGGGGGGDHVDVGGADVGGVEEGHGAGYAGAPVAALGYCFGRLGQKRSLPSISQGDIEKGWVYHIDRIPALA